VDVDFCESRSAKSCNAAWTWPDLKQVWDGVLYALAVVALLGMIALLVAMPE
jgi:hypothetical protein